MPLIETSSVCYCLKLIMYNTVCTSMYIHSCLNIHTHIHWQWYKWNPLYTTNCKQIITDVSIINHNVKHLSVIITLNNQDKIRRFLSEGFNILPWDLAEAVILLCLLLAGLGSRFASNDWSPAIPLGPWLILQLWSCKLQCLAMTPFHYKWLIRSIRGIIPVYCSLENNIQEYKYY